MKITDKQWTSRLQQSEKKREKNHAIAQILRMFVTVMTDMFNNMLEKNKDEIITLWEDMEKLKDYTNKNLRSINKRFNNVVTYYI